MTDWTGAWSAETAAGFLEETTVPLRLACRTPSDRLWLVSLWYRYRDGTFECATSAGAAVVGFLRRNPDVAFEVSTNEPPYAGVRCRGTARVEADPEKAVLRALLKRYLGGTESPLADRLLAADREEVTLRIDPDRAVSWDFTDRMRDSVEART